MKGEIKMIYSKEVENMCPVAKGVNHGPAPIPEEGKWVKATELRERRKGKIKMSLHYKGKDHEAYLSHIKVQITASPKNT